MLKHCINQLIAKKDLTTDEINAVMQEVLSSDNTAQVAAFLVLLHAKGETDIEIAGIANFMQDNMLEVITKDPVLDIVGTGGDKTNTINISTGSAILAASCGVKIAKHGNRNVSSLCGSADVLEKLGVNIDLNPQQVASCITNVGMGFCYAPNFHPAMRALKKIRTQLGVSTSFNLMGPLLNPARAKYLMIGVFKPELLKLMAKVLIRMQVKHAMLFHSAGMDEITCAAKVDMLEVVNGTIKPLTLDAKEFGLKRCSMNDLKGGDKTTNASLLKKAFLSAYGECPAIQDTLILNAAVANYIYGLTPSIGMGVQLAKDNLATGAAYRMLDNLIKHSNSFKK
ncbi:MAG: anthranilate phosphoribosyltransferase [Legionellales bacterium]|nr:MAG: anthranilate phosphoribosyltransferase [Legionellales bacterium]